MSKLIINKDRCKACGYCVVNCPKDALSLSNDTNAKGYPCVSVDHNTCIGCGVCYTVCPDIVFSIVEEETA